VKNKQSETTTKQGNNEVAPITIFWNLFVFKFYHSIYCIFTIFKYT